MDESASSDTSTVSSESVDWDGDSLFSSAVTVRPNPIERAPLIAIIEFESPILVEAELEITDGDVSWVQPPLGPAARRHRIAVLGMRPNRKHEIRVDLCSSDGRHHEQSEPLYYETPPVPDSFPPIRTVLARPQAMEPGVTLFAVNLWKEDQSILDYGYIIVIDETGHVVWFCRTDDRIADMRVLSNGNILYQHGSYRYVREIDLMGRDIRTWYTSNLTRSPHEGAIPVAVDTLHHETLELPNGNFLGLATELRTFDSFPTSEDDPDSPRKPADVVCDVVVEFEPRSGEVVRRLPLTEFLDKRLLGYLSRGGFWKDKYNETFDVQCRDWSHANALQYLPEENAILVSFRHLDCVMKIDWETARTRWILGDPDRWGAEWQPFLLEPVGNMQWFYHQHSPKETPRGTLIMFDNGNYRAHPYSPITPAAETQSRVVEYRIDEQAMTVEQVFEYWGTGDDRFYSPFYGEADCLRKTDNLLITDGGRIELEDGTPHHEVPGERQWARIFEISRSAEQPEKVFEMICDSGLESPFGWSIYRAERLPNLTDDFSIDPPAPDEPIVIHPREPIRKR
ncbi:MAG: aryl-sulfate sulfotransferase [Planctomycetota bacterium]